MSSTSVKTKKTKTITTTTTVPETVVESVPETTTVVETVPETTVELVSETTTLRQSFEALIKAKQDQVLQLKSELQELRRMQRTHEQLIKEAMKRSKKKRVVRDDANPRKPSGFASPVVVSDELYKFLEQYGIKNGDPVARTDVTRHITSYIKEHDLQNPEARREIVPDATLSKLFGPANELRNPEDPKSKMVYTYLKLQRYLSPHFPKKQVSA